MSKRGENIHKRKDGRWEGRYKKGRKPDGQIWYGSVYGKTYREVKEKLSQVSTSSFAPVASQGKEKCFKDVLDLWIENNKIRLKGGTVAKYQNVIDVHIIPELGNVKLSKLNATLINSFLANKLQNGRLDKKGGLSPSYVRSITIVINAAIRFAVNEKMMSPLGSPIYKPAISQKDISILSAETQRKLETYLFQEPTPTKIGILLSLHTGLRIGEVCALSWDDIDFQNSIIHIRHTVARVRNLNSDDSATILVIDTPKTKASTRDIPIFPTLIPILKEMAEKNYSRYVISDTDDFVNPRTYEYRYHKLLDECKIESINYHALRHTFATRCIEAGVDVKSLSEILGHANVSITLNTYVHSSMDMKRTQLEKLYIFSD